MNTKIQTYIAKAVFFFLSVAVFNIAAFAQSSSSTTTHTENTSTSINPMVWYIGGAVVLVIILIIALSGRNKTKVVEKTTRTVE